VAVFYAPETAHAKELAKWEVRRGYQEYPKRMYLAERSPMGALIFSDVQDAESETQERNFVSRGFAAGQAAAVAALEEREQALAVGAAHRAYEDRGLTDKARREAEEADEATDQHLAEIPEKPRRGRPRKIQ